MSCTFGDRLGSIGSVAQALRWGCPCLRSRAGPARPPLMYVHASGSGTSTPVSAIIFFPSLLSLVLSACITSILTAISRLSLASLCDSIRPVVLARHLRVFHLFSSVPHRTSSCDISLYSFMTRPLSSPIPLDCLLDP